MKKRVEGPFVLPVHDIVRKPGEMREHLLTVAPTEDWGEGLVAVSKGEDVELDVRLESVHEGILVSGTASTRYTGECGRCLDPIAESVEVDFQELFAYPGEEASDFEVQDDHVDLETLVRDAIVLSLPFQPVCSPDCPGLDPETGERRDENTDVPTSAPIDPRWAALEGFIDHSAAGSSHSAEKEES